MASTLFTFLGMSIKCDFQQILLSIRVCLITQFTILPPAQKGELKRRHWNNNHQKLDKFLEMNNLPRLKHAETENINRLSTSTETETMIIQLPHMLHFPLFIYLWMGI